jgi:hypothetical protein
MGRCASNALIELRALLTIKIVVICLDFFFDASDADLYPLSKQPENERRTVLR